MFRNNLQLSKEFMKHLLPLFICLYSFSSLSAQVRLPRIVRDSMILQRDQPLQLWGWAAPGEKLQLKFNNKNYRSSADAQGQWKLQLPPTPAGGPYTLEFKSSNTIILREVLFGDVWLCSGQSNMVHQLNIHDVTYAKEIAEANNPAIRQFWIPTLTSLKGPKEDLPSGFWKPAVGDEVRPFSAVAYFFAKKLYERYRVPIGIINASVGGTPVEAWTGEEGLAAFPDMMATIQKNKDSSYVAGLAKAAADFPKTPLPADAGLNGPVKWFDAGFEPRGWRTINIPGFWEDQGIRDLNGIVWYRKELELPASMEGKEAKVFLGRIVDADELYINGKLVGTTSYQYPQRRYKVPANLLKAGMNSFVIRVTNTAAKGGFVYDKPYCIFAGTDTVDLKGTWQYKVGAVYRPEPNSVPLPLNAQNQPTALYNAMIAPIVGYPLKGICWYQGESNAGRAVEYDQLLPALANHWRTVWKQGELPFLYVQLPGYMDYNYLPTESNWARLREAQLKALKLSNSAMVVAIDLGEWNDIHPDNKKEVGERLALPAFKLAYGEAGEYSGPLYKSNRIDGNKIILEFDHTGNGLMSNDGEPLEEFAIAGADKKFVWAKAVIQGNQVIVWSDEIVSPMYVRYAWADNPVHPNLFNKEGLPASPFRTDW